MVIELLQQLRFKNPKPRSALLHVMLYVRFFEKVIPKYLTIVTISSLQYY